MTVSLYNGKSFKMFTISNAWKFIKTAILVDLDLFGVIIAKINKKDTLNHVQSLYLF